MYFAFLLDHCLPSSSLKQVNMFSDAAEKAKYMKVKRRAEDTTIFEF